MTYKIQTKSDKVIKQNKKRDKNGGVVTERTAKPAPLSVNIALNNLSKKSCKKFTPQYSYIYL